MATLKPQAAPGIVPAAAAIPAGGAMQPGGIPEPMEAAEPGPVGMTEDIIQKVSFGYSETLGCSWHCPSHGGYPGSRYLFEPQGGIGLRLMFSLYLCLPLILTTCIKYLGEFAFNWNGIQETLVKDQHCGLYLL